MLSLRSVVETGHSRVGGNLCDPSASIIVSGNSGSDSIFFGGGFAFDREIRAQFPDSTPNVTKNTIPGSTIWWRWDEDTEAKSGVSNYNSLIITHQSSLNVGLPQDQIDRFLNSCDTWVNHYWQNANNGNGDGKVWFWGTQPRIVEPDYIGNARYRHEMWSRAQDRSNIKRPSGAPRVQLITGYHAFQKMYEDHLAGETPYPEFWDDVYTGVFHVGDKGMYASLVMHMACVFGVDPRNVTPQPDGLTLTLAESEYIRQVCYEVMHWTERHGVDVTAWDN